MERKIASRFMSFIVAESIKFSELKPESSKYFEEKTHFVECNRCLYMYRTFGGLQRRPWRMEGRSGKY